MTVSRIHKSPKLRGFSLVEVLIALVIMSVGMLGIAGLYVQSMQAGRTSMFRHHAVTLASDIADRIRANPTAQGSYGSVFNDEGTDNGCVALGNDCDPDEMAQHDISIWHDQAEEVLPNGRVQVVFTGPGVGVPPTYQIQVQWDEPNPIGGGQPEFQFTVPVLPL